MRDQDRVSEVIADELRGAEPGEEPARLCAVAVRLLPVGGASTALSADGVPLLLGASDARAEWLMAVQVTLGEGPCVRAAAIGAPVHATELTGGWDASRWPLFAPQAAAAGIRAIHALPLGAGSRTPCVGTLDLYCEVPGALTRGDLRVAHTVAAATVDVLLSLARHADGARLWPGPSAADHAEMNQAVGMVMAQLRVDADEALVRLRARAFVQGRTVRDLAHEVVSRRRTPYDLYGE